MSKYIKRDLAARLRSGSELPVEQMTLEALAAYYQVSLTPVRAAVAELVDEGLIEKGPNRRLRVVAQPLSAVAPQPFPPPDPPRDLLPIVANDLVELCIAGDPVYLREEATAEKYGVSRTVIRNIFHRLAGEGLVDHIARRGWCVKPFRMRDLKAFTEVRVVLELKALDMARPKLVPAELQRMLEANVPAESPGDVPRSDESLHDYIITLAGNPYIKDFLQRRISRYFRMLLKREEGCSREVRSKVAREHRQILSALLEQRWRAARRALRDHILDNCRFAIDLIGFPRNGVEQSRGTLSSKTRS